MGKLKVIIIGAILALSALLFCFAYIKCNQTICEPETEKKAQNLIINTPEPCDIGTLTIKHQGEILYEYTGKINIINDGSNGEQINILIEYPDESVPEIKEGE